MTTKTQQAIIAFLEAFRKEIDRGHIPDETGALYATTGDLLIAVIEEEAFVHASEKCSACRGFGKILDKNNYLGGQGNWVICPLCLGTGEAKH